MTNPPTEAVRRPRADAIRTEWAAISADNLEAASAGTPYREQARFVSGTLRATDKSRLTSGPAVVADPYADAKMS